MCEIDVPHDEAQLVSDSFSSRKSILVVVHYPSTFLFRQFPNELFVVLLLGSPEHYDGSSIIRQAVHDVGELFASFELLELLEAFLGLSERSEGEEV